MSEGPSSGSGHQGEMPRPDTGAEGRIQGLIRQLADIEAELARVSEMGGIDSVIDPATITPILLRQAQADLAASEARYHRLVQALSAIVFELMPDGQVLFVNDAVALITGYAPGELQRQDYWEFLLPGDLRRQGDELVRQLATGNVSCYELVVAAKDGSRIVLEVNTANQYLPDGSLERIVGIATDISKRKQAEEALRASEEQLRAYARRMVDAIESERRNLARELHDQAGQSMAALKLSLGRLRRDVDGQGRHAERFEEIGQLVDGVMDGLHRLATDLRPVSLDRYGLAVALQQYLEFYRQQSGLLVDLVTVGVEEQRLLPEVETAVYRVVQEALTNVLRHAKARRVGVMLERRRDQLIAIVEDDGVGFDPDAAMRCGRLGLLGMRERAEMLGGTLTIESGPRKGTAIYLEVPARPKRIPT